MSVISKTVARELLESRDLAGISEWAASQRGVLRVLFSFTYDSSDLIRWRAIEAIGKVAAVVFKSYPEKIKDFIRRLLWLMNDESGGLGWYAPEVFGEILVNIPELVDEYGSLIPPYLHEEPFEAGSRFAIYRIALSPPVSSPPTRLS